MTLLILVATHIAAAVAGAVSSYLFLRANPKKAAAVAAIANAGAQVVTKVEDAAHGK